MPLVPSVLRSFRNPAIVSLVLTWVMDGLQLAVLVTLFPFFIRYYIKPNGPAAEAIGPVFLPATFIGEDDLFLAAVVLAIPSVSAAAMILSPAPPRHKHSTDLRLCGVVDPVVVGGGAAVWQVPGLDCSQCPRDIDKPAVFDTFRGPKRSCHGEESHPHFNRHFLQFPIGALDSSFAMHEERNFDDTGDNGVERHT